MAQRNVDIVRRALEAIRSGPPDTTVEIAVALGDPDIEFASRLMAVEGATYRRHAGVRRYFSDMADAFEEWRNEPDEIVEIGPDVVFVHNNFRAVGKGSGVTVELRSAIVLVLSNGKLKRVYSYATREEALEAAGLV